MSTRVGPMHLDPKHACEQVYLYLSTAVLELVGHGAHTLRKIHLIAGRVFFQALSPSQHTFCDRRCISGYGKRMDGNQQA